MIVTGTEAVATTLCTTSHTYVMAVTHTCLIILVLPVGISIVALIQRVLIFTSQLTHSRELRTVHHRILLKDGLEVDIAIVRNLSRSTLRTLNGGNDNDTIGTTRTVDRGCRGGLQDIHRLDVSGVDITQLTHEGDTIEHNQRVVAGTQ